MAQATMSAIEFGFRGPARLHDGELVRFAQSAARASSRGKAALDNVPMWQLPAGRPPGMTNGRTGMRGT
jgi:hypothetical protein